MNEIKVGDIFVNTWGYDQTNQDAYQVIRLTPKMMILQEIDTKPVPGTEGFMCCEVVPVKDSFKPDARPFKARQSQDFALNYGYCKRHVDGANYYNSWYA
jgi:hypothetical protein